MVFEKIRLIVSDHLGIDCDEIFQDSSLVNMGATRVDILGIAMSLEAEFGIKIPDDHLGIFDSLDDVLRYVQVRTR